jgi:hypothetical protein
MEATPDPTPSRRDVLGDHPKSFDPVYSAGTAEDRNEAEAAEKATKLAAERKAAEEAKAAEEKAKEEAVAAAKAEEERKKEAAKAAAEAEKLRVQEEER